MTVVMISSYIISLSMMSSLVKCVYAMGFNYVQFMTATHFGLTAVVGFGLLVSRNKPIRVPSWTSLGTGILPIAVANAMSIGFANRGLFFCNAHYYEMIGSTSIFVTAGIGCLLGKHLPLQMTPALLLLTSGLVTISVGEPAFSVIGTVFIVSAVFCRGAKAQLQSLLMIAEDAGVPHVETMDPIELVAWSGASCCLIMLAWSIVTEGEAPWMKISQRLDQMGIVCFSAMVACSLNIFALFVMKELGPVGQQAVGTLKGLLSSLASVVILGETIGLQQMIGYGIVIVAICWYNRIDAAVKQATSSEKLPLTRARAA